MRGINRLEWTPRFLVPISKSRFNSALTMAVLASVVVCWGSFVVAQPGDSSKPEVSIKKKTYQIKGSSVSELRAEMTKLGPRDKSKVQRDAYTSWYVRWTHSCQRSHGGHRLDSISVRVEVEMTFPKWSTPSNAPEELRDKWDAFVSALETHEAGHKDVGISAGATILTAFKELPDYPTV